MTSKRRPVSSAIGVAIAAGSHAGDPSSWPGRRVKAAVRPGRGSSKSHVVPSHANVACVEPPSPLAVCSIKVLPNPVATVP